MNTEKQVRLAARLYELRDFARNLHGTAWPQRSADWQRFITAASEQRGIGVIEAATLLAKGNGCPPLWVAEIMGAAVEMIETEGQR